jgi:hypothetical protein
MLHGRVLRCWDGDGKLFSRVEKRGRRALLLVNTKKQKNFDLFDVTQTVAQNREAAQKFFGAFFQKRTAFFL